MILAGVGAGFIRQGVPEVGPPVRRISDGRDSLCVQRPHARSKPGDADSTTRGTGGADGGFVVETQV